MFRCQKCNTTTNPGEKETKIIIETRKVSYKKPSYDKGKKFITTTHGTEIVREIKVCPRCALEYEKAKLEKDE